jgi:hypothetical protein
MLVAWSRLVGGRIHDPAVGLSLLVGVFAGVCIEVNGSLAYLAAEVLGTRPVALVQSHAFVLSESKEIIGLISASQTRQFFDSAFVLLTLLLVRVVVRRERLALVVTWVILTVLVGLLGGVSWSVAWRWYAVAVGVAILLGVLIRFGFLAATITFLARFLASNAPLTLDTHQWYFENGLFVMAFLLCIATYGCCVSLGGRSFLRGLFG